MRQKSTLLEDIRRIIRLYDSMLKPVCQWYGLVPLEATIISFLHNNPGKDTAADIVEYRMLSKSNVSTAVESLIQMGLLLRRQDQEDRRKIHLSITPEARPITQEIEAVREAFRKNLFRGFSEKELELFGAFQQRLAENTKIAMERRDEQ